MTVMFADIYNLLNLPTDGELLYSGFSDPSRNKFACSLDASQLAYLTFISQQMGHDNDLITFQEETSFYLYWICKFLLCNSSKRATLGFAHIVVASTKGKRLALSPFILTILYRCLFTLTQSYFTISIHSPLWILLLWIYAYFPLLAHFLPNYSSTPPVCYAQAFFEA